MEDSQFKTALDTAFNHVIITDENGKVIYANKRAEETTGFTFEEMRENTPRLWGRQMSPEFYKNLWKVIKEDKKPFSGTILNKRKNGSLYYAKATITPIIKDNVATAFVGVEEDITDILEKNKELEQKIADIERLNKIMIGRELKMQELKQEIENLKHQTLA